MQSARVLLWAGGEDFPDYPEAEDEEAFLRSDDYPAYDCGQWRPQKRLRDVQDDIAINFFGPGHNDLSGSTPAVIDAYSYGWRSADGTKEKRRHDGGHADLDSIPQTSSSSGAPDSPSLNSRIRGPSGTGSMFFKTKLCIKFRAGTCPYNSNCNFAHGMEELRSPPPGWEEIVAMQEARNTNKELNNQLILSSSVAETISDSQRFRRTRRCKKYYTDEGCPYGDRCNFLHDDQARSRESNAISLGPTTGSFNGGGNSNSGGEKPSNWKTRMCNKWEVTGHCPFGQKCNFAHGVAELQAYGGVHMEAETGANTSAVVMNDLKNGRVPTKSHFEARSSYASSAYASDVHDGSVKYRAGFLLSTKAQKQAHVSASNWKGPADEISTIYGDWIEEDE